MRSVGQLPTQDLAHRFGDHLYVQGIENEVEEEDDGKFSVWVLDDTQVAQATALLLRFMEKPDSAEFAGATSEAERMRTKEEREERSRRSTVADSARVDYERNFAGFAWMPVILIVACVAFAIYSHVGENREALRWFLISTSLPLPPPIGAGSLPEVRDGQVWRLVTPIFIHFGWIHLLFNMFWLRDLGTFVQNRFGPWYLGALVLVTAVLSNLLQYFWSGYPIFGGMSGVNYALFGFLWMRGKYDRHAAWSLNPQIVQTMLVWFFLCIFLSKTIGMGVANAAHFGGLVSGMAWGFLTSGRVRFSR